MPQQMSLFSQMAQIMQSLMLQSQGNVTLDNGITLEMNGEPCQVGSAILDKLRQGPETKKYSEKNLHGPPPRVSEPERVVEKQVVKGRRKKKKNEEEEDACCG